MSEKAKEEQSTSPPGYIHMGVLGTALILASVTWWVTRNPTHPPKIHKPALYAGKIIDAPITLVTADKWDLACMAKDDMKGMHCEFQEDKKPWPGANVRDPAQRKKLLAPYMTVDNTMFLIPGLFEESAIADRYRDELPFGKSRQGLERFTAQCKLKVIKKLSNVRVRWRKTGDWQGPQSVWVGTVSACQINDP